jgi:hypothetical protein
MYKFVSVVVSGINFLCLDEKGTLCNSATVPAAVISLSPVTISATVPEMKGMGRRYKEE